MTTKSIVRDILGPQVEEAIKATGILDDYSYEVSLQVLPTPQGPQPVVSILLAVPNPAALGGYLSTMTVLPGPFPEDIMISTAVNGLVDSLGQQRAEALGNSQQSGGGLILP